MIYSTYVTEDSLWKSQVIDAVDQIDRQLTTFDEESLNLYYDRNPGLRVPQPNDI